MWSDTNEREARLAMERQLEKEFGDMCMVCQKSGAAFECEHCLERPFCGESCLRKHALRCTNCVGMAFGLSGRDVIASDCLTGSPIDPSKKVATAGDPDDPIATFKLHALDAVMRSPKGLGKIRKIMELASDANFAKLASPATTDYLKFDAAFVRDLEFICGMGSIAHVCRSRQKFAAALPEDCRLTMVLDASKDLQKQLRVISEGIEISDEQQLEKCYSRVRIAHIVDSATRIDLGSAHGTCTMLLDSMPTMNPPMPDDRKTKFVMDAVNALVTLPRFSRIDTIRISNIVLDSGYSAGAKKAASAAPLVRRALDRVEFVNCHFGSSIGAKELEEIAMEPANVTLLTAANISFRGMLIPFDRTLFEYMLHRDLIAKTETRMSITGMIQYDALEMLDCLMFRRNRRLILDTFEISVIVSPIKTTGCGIQTSVLPIRKLRLLQTGRPHTSEPEPILRHFACEALSLDDAAFGSGSPFEAIDLTRLRELSIEMAGDDIADFVKFAAALGNDRKRSRLLTSLRLKVPLSADLTIDDIVIFLQTWPSLKHLIVEDSEDALTHEAVAALRGARIGELPKSISGDVCTVAPYSPSKQVCVQTRAKLEATKAELETLVLVPTGDCREWITSLSPVTIRSIKKLHVAISCAGNESGDVSQMFGGVRFPNLEDLAVIRVHPVLSRTPFGDVLNSAAGVAPKLVAFSVVDVFPISRSDEEEAPVKRGRRFDNLGMMSYVAINDQDATHKSPVFITACDICDTIITTCPTISDFTFEVTGNSVLIADSRIATTSRVTPLDSLARVIIHIREQSSAALLGMEFVELAKNLQELEIAYDQLYVSPDSKSFRDNVIENKEKFRTLSSKNREMPFAMYVRHGNEPAVRIDEQFSGALNAVTSASKVPSLVYVV